MIRGILIVQQGYTLWWQFMFWLDYSKIKWS